MTEKPRNAMQAVLDRAAQAEPPPPVVKPRAERPPKATDERPPRAKLRTTLAPEHPPYRRAFPARMVAQLRILAAEEDTTVQALLEEAINLLLAKKARGRLPGRRV